MVTALLRMSALLPALTAAAPAFARATVPAGPTTTTSAAAASAPVTEADYYRLETFSPPGVQLEVSGLTTLKDGQIMLATRGGEVYVIENPYGDPEAARFRRWTFGLSTPLGLIEHQGWIWVAQRGELTRIRDTDRDGIADFFETVSDAWELGGNYHEYAFGPRVDRKGFMWITLNKPFGEQPYGRAHWRGWAVKIDTRTGKMHPVAAGLRSPAGVEVSPWGEVFYTDNQGEWCNASKLAHIGQNEFHGHPWGLPSVELPESPIKSPKEEEVPEGEFMKDLKARIPNFKMPAVWFPYDKMGKSPAGMRWDLTGGKFGPFRNQIFVGDQHHSWVMRVFLEKVNGHWQGAAFRFREGFQSGIVRLTFGRDGSLFAGLTNAGWGSKGTAARGLQRLVWTGRLPFEIHEMRARHDGFELTFTKPVDAKISFSDPGTYNLTSYTYRLRSNYGGPEEDVKTLDIRSAKVDQGGRRVRLVVSGLRAGYVHELRLKNARAADGTPLLHPEAYYTLVEIPKR
jgi:glucose/arabinose dehydrogenase